MHTPLFDIHPIAEKISQGALLLTPNQRLAKILQEAYHNYQISNHTTTSDQTTNQYSTAAWLTPKIYPIEIWLQKCWQCLSDLGIEGTEKILTDSSQDSTIWRQVIQSKSEQTLINSQQTASHAQQAYEHLLLWQLNINDPSIRESFSWQENSALFLQWLDSYQSICQSKQLITLYETAEILRKNLLNNRSILSSERSICPATEIIITGFTDLAPLYASILNSFDIPIHTHKANITPRNTSRLCLPDSESEIRAAAQWAKKHLENSSTDSNQSKRIAVIIPDLAERRQQIEHIFYETLQADYMLPQQQRQLPAFNISAAQTLGDCPLIYTALCLLKLNFHQIEFKDILYLLHSPFIFNWPHDQYLRAHIEIAVRNHARQFLSSAEFRQLVKQSIDVFTESENHQFNQNDETDTQNESSIKPMNIAEALQQFEIIHKQFKGQHPLSFFIQCFQQQLQLLNWPGQRTLDSIEYQQHQHWQESLQQLSQMDYLYDTMSFNNALEQCRLHMSNQAFQAQTKPCQLQILGLLEGAGLQFDYCWISSLTDQVLPAIASPNPLLPLELQKNHHMPRASQRRECEFAEALLAIYQHSTTTEFNVSYSQFVDDRELRPSPLISNDEIFPAAEINVQQNHNTLTSLIAGSSDMELICCDNAPPVSSNETTKGGSAILKDQAAGSIFSFLIHRLSARDLAEPYYGLSVLDRGNILHQCLAILWAQLKTQEQLLNLNKQQCSDLITFSIQAALDHFADNHHDCLKPRLRALEIQRLHTLLHSYLQLEKHRPPFKVLAREKSQTLNLSGLSMQLRIDRIDQLEDGSILLIDYKSATVSLKGWLDERLSDPQLPLYAFINSDANIHADSNGEAQQLTLMPLEININPQISGLCFAQINAEQCTYLGIGKNDNGLQGMKTLEQLPKDKQVENWEGLTDNWQNKLTQLAKEFSSGHLTTGSYSSTAFFYDYLQTLIRPQDIMEIHEKGTLTITSDNLSPSTIRSNDNHHEE